MKYLYKQTGIMVESDTVLDSAMFQPIEDGEKAAEVESASKATATRKKTTTAKKQVI